MIEICVLGTTAQVQPKAWQPSAAEMKEAKKVEPADEPEGIIQVLPYADILRKHKQINWRLLGRIGTDGH